MSMTYMTRLPLLPILAQLQVTTNERIQGYLMTNQQTFDDLTPEQQAQLTALLEKLETFPVSERIVRCEEAIGDSTSEADRIRIDAAMAAAWAYNRMLLYLERL